MKKTAFVFPDQGTQFVGMGKDMYNNFPEARKVFEIASEKLHMDMAKLCFESSEHELLQTQNQQPAIHTVEIAILRVIEKYNIAPFVTAGFSLGEYGALVCAHSIDFQDSVQLVQKRGVLMQNALPEGIGKMLSISGLSSDTVMNIVQECSKIALIECSNFNCPGQIIVSGYKEAVEAAQVMANKLGAKSTSFLKVSGPFHTSLLRECGNKLRKELDKIQINQPSINFIPNVTAKQYLPEDDLLNLLDLHVSKAVLWEDSIRTMMDLGVHTFLEIGPTGSLSKFNQRTIDVQNYHADIFHIQDLQGLENFLKVM